VDHGVDAKRVAARSTARVEWINALIILSVLKSTGISS
jgi:hypothetical protein